MEVIIQTRPAAPEDASLLLALFAETRGAELAQLGLAAEQMQSLLEMQFRGLQMTYSARFPHAEKRVICLDDGTPAGYYLLDRQPDAWRIVDLAVRAVVRGKGIGSAAVAECQRQCGELGIPLRLSVASNNRAQRLYLRMGFVITGADAMQTQMEWTNSRPGARIDAASIVGETRESQSVAGRGASRKWRSKAWIAAVLAAFCFAAESHVTAQAVLTVTPGATATTVAGSGIAGYSGDNGAATSATFASPSAVAYDASGDLYIADRDNNVIRMVSPSGTITTVAGNGQQGFSGDGGPATSAELNAPTGIAVDTSGNIYIADSENNRIREVSNGTITTIAGNGVAGYSGDSGAATAGELALPGAIAVDTSGNLYIADTDNERIRKVSGGIIATVAGNGEQGFSGDGGAATSASLDTPSGVAVDASGNVFIADSHNQRIREVSGGTIATVAGSGPVTFSGDYSGDGGSATSAQLAKPTGVAIDAAGNIYIADTNNNRLREVGNGSIATAEGTGMQGDGGDGGTATSASLNTPRGVALSSGGNAVVADSLNQRVRGDDLPELAYPAQNVGVPSAAQYITLANTGSGTLAVQSLTFTGSFQAASGGTCSALPISLTAGQSCTQAIVFSPTAAGSAQGTVIVGGSGVVPQTILLTGSASISSITPLLSSSLNPSIYGEAVTLTAAAPAGANPVPTGAMTFYDGATALQTVSLTNGSASVTTTVLAAGTHSITATYSGDTAWQPATSAALSQLVNQAVSSINLVTSTPVVLLENPVLLTATVSSGTGVPTGTVMFLDGTTAIGSAPLNAGVATLTTSALTSGTHSITAVYGGNANFTSITSAAVSEQVEDFSLNFSSASVTSTTVLPGGTAIYKLALTPSGGTTFPAAITFSASGLPSGAVATFTPTTISAGAGPTDVTLTIQVPNTAAALHPQGIGHSAPPLYLGLLILPFAALRRRARDLSARRSARGSWMLVLVVAASLAALAGMTGCSYSSGFFGQKQQSYTVTITGTSGALSHSASAQLTVE